LSLRKQCELLGISISSFYYKKQDILEKYQKEAGIILEIFEKAPFYGYRRVFHELKRREIILNHKTVLKIMKSLKIEAIYPKQKMKNQGTKTLRKAPYLLKGMVVSRKNQVWTTDITYIKLPGGFVYLAAILDIYSRFVLAWRIYNGSY
jgi:putative transposase